MKRFKQKGFTLIELMVVVAVIGVLAAIAVPQYQNYIKKSQFAEVINMTSAIKISDALCMKEYNQKIGCSGGTNNVIADITAINKTKYTLSVVTLDGVITATARGPNDAAAIATATAAAGLPAAPTATESINPTSNNLTFAGWPTFNQLPGGIAVYTGTLLSNVHCQIPSSLANMTPLFCTAFPVWQSSTMVGYVQGTVVCPTPASGSAYTINPTNQMCERPNPNPPAASTGNPGSSLNNESYILNPTIDETGKITYTVGGTCIAAGLCQAN